MLALVQKMHNTRRHANTATATRNINTLIDCGAIVQRPLLFPFWFSNELETPKTVILVISSYCACTKAANGSSQNFTVPGEVPYYGLLIFESFHNQEFIKTLKSKWAFKHCTVMFCEVPLTALLSILCILSMPMLIARTLELVQGRAIKLKHLIDTNHESTACNRL